MSSSVPVAAPVVRQRLPQARERSEALEEDQREEWPLDTTADTREVSPDAAKVVIAAYVRNNPGCGYLDLACALWLSLEAVVDACADLRADSQVRAEAVAGC